LGAAPNRQFVVQWTNYRRYVQTGHSLNFQIKLNEGGGVALNQTVQIHYGSQTFNATTNNAQVGLRGTSNAVFNNRFTISNWNTTTAGTANNSTCTFSTLVTPPTSGLTFTWSPPAGCAGTPATPVASGPASSVCAAANFSLTSTGATIGSGISYQWQVSTNGGSTWSNITGATNTSATTSLTTASSYRLVTSCSFSGLSSTSNVVNVTLNSNFLACYCASAASTTADEEITNVTFGSLNNSSTCFTLAPGPGSIAQRYSNYTNQPSLIPTVFQGDAVPLSVTMTTCGGNYTNTTVVYIDYNRNGIFTDLGELVYTGPISFGNHTASTTIVIPTTASLGQTQMRV
ncbi:MAG: GEVED domain-containing protein, partial [Bacteroidota bacterium]